MSRDNVIDLSEARKRLRGVAPGDFKNAKAVAIRMYEALDDKEEYTIGDIAIGAMLFIAAATRDETRTDDRKPIKEDIEMLVSAMLRSYFHVFNDHDGSM